MHLSNVIIRSDIIKVRLSTSYHHPVIHVFIKCSTTSYVVLLHTVKLLDGASYLIHQISVHFFLYSRSFICTYPCIKLNIFIPCVNTQFTIQVYMVSDRWSRLFCYFVLYSYALGLFSRHTMVRTPVLYQIKPIRVHKLTTPTMMKCAKELSNSSNQKLIQLL